MIFRIILNYVIFIKCEQFFSFYLVLQKNKNKNNEEKQIEYEEVDCLQKNIHQQQILNVSPNFKLKRIKFHFT